MHTNPTGAPAAFASADVYIFAEFARVSGQMSGWRTTLLTIPNIPPYPLYPRPFFGSAQNLAELPVVPIFISRFA